MALDKMKNLSLEDETFQAELDELEGILIIKPTCSIWDQVWNFKARPDDVLIATYAKAGTTWTQEIVDMIQQNGDIEKCRRATTYKRHPFLEWYMPVPPTHRYSGLELAEAMLSPRTLKTHLPGMPVSLHPRQPGFLIQIAQQSWPQRFKTSWEIPRHWLWRKRESHGDSRTDGAFTAAGAVTLFSVLWGSWYDHVKGWWKAKDKHRILYLFYEDMKENPKREIQKIMKFLEKDLDPEVLNKIIYNTSFEIMKENPMANYTKDFVGIMDHSVSPFMRKGAVGDWKNYFTVTQNQKFDEDYKKKMADTSLIFRMQL
ncbi:ST1C1 Sulfotransferase, partial [Alectura lathami]|nr:ST1C1 Sulfotransferase [Alectura lathami]